MTSPEMENAIRKLQDAMLVQVDIEARLSRGLKNAAEWLESHDARIAEHEAQIRGHEARMLRIETNLSEATEKLDALIKFVAQQHNLPEA
jgi:hypothetical protein